MDDIIRYFDGFQPDINSMILGALTLLIFILIVYLIIFSRNIAKAAKRANRTMENIEKISTITLKKSMQLDSASNDFIEAVSKIASALKGQQSLISAISFFIKLSKGTLFCSLAFIPFASWQTCFTGLPVHMF